MASGYVELHCHSNFSFLDGASHPEVLAEQAGRLGYAACALTDHNGLYGSVRFGQAAERHGIKPIVGAEITLAGGYHLILLVRNDTGYAHLCRLLSAAQLQSRKGEARVAHEMLAAHTDGLIALSGCAQGEIPALLLAGREKEARVAADRYTEWFGRDHFYLELQHHNLPVYDELCTGLARLGHTLKLGLVATNNVHYAGVEGRPLADVLTCIRHHVTLDTAGDLLFPNAERYLKTAQEMEQRFRGYPEAVANTLVSPRSAGFPWPTCRRRCPSSPCPRAQRRWRICVI